MIFEKIATNGLYLTGINCFFGIKSLCYHKNIHVDMILNSHLYVQKSMKILQPSKRRNQRNRQMGFYHIRERFRSSKRKWKKRRRKPSSSGSSRIHLWPHCTVEQDGRTGPGQTFSMNRLLLWIITVYMKYLYNYFSKLYHTEWRFLI